MCKDGVTPCHHLGYKFHNGEYIYFVADQGSLEISRNGKVILHEEGSWNWDTSN